MMLQMVQCHMMRCRITLVQLAKTVHTDFLSLADELCCQRISLRLELKLKASQSLKLDDKKSKMSRASVQ